MYLKKFSIEHIKCFDKKVELDFSAGVEGSKRWNIILGENGIGKSTLLQAIAIALMGPDPANRLRRPDGWVRKGFTKGNIFAEIVAGDKDGLTGAGQPRKRPYQASYTITGNDEIEVGGILYDRPTIVFDGTKSQLNALKRGPLSEKSTGWFAAGYGPFRRLRGGSPDAIRLMYPGKTEARFATLFREDAALEDLNDWLKDLDHRRRSDSETAGRAERLLASIETITKNLLPAGVSLAAINAQGVFFDTPYSRDTLMQDLSDGYRSMLALSTDLLRRLDGAFNDIEDWFDGSQITAEGVVLIDELDAHLHPNWQRQIGFWLQRAFPAFQFIIATHSPFITQSASDDGIFVLRQETIAKGASVSETTSASVVCQSDEVSVRGWRVDQILNILFDVPTLRSPEAEAKMRRYAELKVKASVGGGFSDAEQQEFDGLQSWLDRYLSPPGSTSQEMAEQYAVKQRVDDFLRTHTVRKNKLL